MRLEQGQIWKQGEEYYYRIVEWERMAIEYKLMTDPLTKEGTLHRVTKKEFCRLIKGAELVKLQKPARDDAEDDLLLEEAMPEPLPETAP
jgi:hypothetical protein